MRPGTWVKEDLVDKVNTSVPKRPRRNPNRPAWMNQQILTEILKRKRMWKISKDSGRYEEQSRLVKQMIKNAGEETGGQVGGQQQALLLLCEEQN